MASLERELKEINKRLEDVLDEYQNRMQNQENTMNNNVTSQQNSSKQLTGGQNAALKNADNKNESKTCVIL